MSSFIKKSFDSKKIELTIDTKIFPKDIILKSAYNFLDKWYFYFTLLEDNNINLFLTLKEDTKIDSEKLIANFLDELLSVYLRDKLEKDNKVIREKIVTTAISSAIDNKNYVSIDKENTKNEIDFDKDIDEILKEIENDPELKIDEEEIKRILEEIEEESLWEENNISLDINWVEDAKKRFQDRD